MNLLNEVWAHQRGIANLIYMIQCNNCNMQYIGETKRQLSDRFGEHRHYIEKARNTHPTAV